MKRSGLLFLVLLIATFSQAQIIYGIKGGLNLSDVVINNITNPDVEAAYKVKAGLHAGAFVSVDGENDFGLAVELLYSNKGVNALNRINLHYVVIPILLRYKLKEKWTAETGPEVGYLITANSKYGNLNSTWDNKLDLGLVGGLQYQLGKIYLGVRFNAGITSVIRTAAAASGERIRYLNRVAQLSMAIPLRKIMY
jgi:hypothetical protein